jgi:hypothetical protein
MGRVAAVESGSIITFTARCQLAAPTFGGIAADAVPAKFYASVLEVWVSAWAEVARPRAEGQFGFWHRWGTWHAMRP